MVDSVVMSILLFQITFILFPPPILLTFFNCHKIYFEINSPHQISLFKIFVGVGAVCSRPISFIACALLQEQSSQDGSRRMLFPLKKDNSIRSKKKKKNEECVCVCVKIQKIGLRWRGHYILNDEKMQWCRLLQCFCHGCFFSKGSPSACILITKK